MHPADMRWAGGPLPRVEGRREARTRPKIRVVPREGKEVNRRPGGGERRGRAVTPLPPPSLPAATGRGSGAWGLGLGLSRTRARVERELDCGKIWTARKTTPQGKWISWVPGRAWLTLDPDQNDPRD
ncbi:hypothetical protein NDU88_006460 [Pleurodeles waltl]|uniref:Uncharacterized protein n=1 Tax=Pleurodeles waltl TaxID=8319 RepID=A0AAV7VMU1_PLEWA|nr:hypothetical protein NDU88_006460 [Pleurodeles waltl]